jgi:hypothetical protein
VKHEGDLSHWLWGDVDRRSDARRFVAQTSEKRGKLSFEERREKS